MQNSSAAQGRGQKKAEDLKLSGARRLGFRRPTRFLVFIKDGRHRLRARATEISTTGVVLDPRFLYDVNLDRVMQLDLVVPGFARPIHVVARPVRKVGRLLACEFLSIKQVDQLSLAEHLDRLSRPGGA